MIKVTTSFFLLISLAGYGQLGISRIKQIELPDSTEIGAPVGDALKKEIGEQGGIVKSGDGRLELIFPAGALSKTTNISIIPTANIAPNGTGNSYQLEPSGIQFKKPVEVIFHYSEDEASTCPPELMGFAQQDHNGKWSFLDYDSWDSTTKSLRGRIEHFSAFANQNIIQLSPKKYDLIIGDTLIVAVTFRDKRKKSGFGNSLILESNEMVGWFVNNKPNGDAVYGTITPIDLREQAFATYVTPEILPNNPRVKISVEVIGLLKKSATRIPLSSIVNLRDEYKVKITDTIETRAGEGTFITDSATFIVKISPSDLEVTDVKNYPPSYFVKHKPPMGKLKVLIGPDCTGPVHIGIVKKNGTLLSYSRESTPASNDKQKEVLIHFDAAENIIYRYNFSLPGGVNLNNKEVSVQTVPTLIHFYPNGKKQRYVIDTDALTRYTVTVERTPHNRTHLGLQ